VTDRLAELVLRVERAPDAADVRAAAQELMREVLDMHGATLTRVLELVAASDGDAGGALRAIAADPELHAVLELHGLLPEVSSDSTPVTLLPTRAPAAHVEDEDRARCEMCGRDAGPDHPHVLDLEAAGVALACACRPCHLLLTSPGAGGGRWRAVPDEWRRVGSVELAQVPVGVAFVVVDSRRDRPVAYYPGPAGATESELAVAIDALPAMAPDVEALVVRDGEGFVVPVSAAFARRRAAAGPGRVLRRGRGEGPMTVRALKSIALVIIGWLVVTSIPGLAKYLRIRET
jgi:hypothetical protein